MKRAKFKIMIKMRVKKKQHLQNLKKSLPKKAKQSKKSKQREAKKKIKRPKLKQKIPLI